MLESLVWLPATAVIVLVTYLLHSTLLLLGAWLVVRLTHTKSYALTEQVWKSAAVAGLITTAAHLSLGFAAPVFQLPLVSKQQASTSPDPLRSKERLVEAPRIQKTDADDATTVQSSASMNDTQLVIVDRDVQLKMQPLRMTLRKERTPEESFETVMSQAAPLLKSIPAPSEEVVAHRDPALNENSQHESANTESNGCLQPFSVKALKRFFTDNLLDRRSLSFAIAATLLVIAVLFGRLIVQTVSFRRRVARLRPLKSERARSLLDQLMQHAGIRRRVGLYSSNVYSEPVAFGIVRWHIVLPDGLDKDLPPEEMRALLAHELAHLVRGDTFWLWIGHVLCSVFAFQPLNFLARKSWRRAAEFQCDDWAVGKNVAPLTLARCLMRVAERRQKYRPCAASLAAVGSKSTLSNRVERLVEKTDRRDRWQRGRYRRIVEAATLILISGLAVWGPSATMPARSQSPSTASSADASAGETRNSISESDIRFPAGARLRVNSGAPKREPNSSMPVDDEFTRLYDEMNELVAGTTLLSTEAKTRPELRPTIDKLAAQIDQLQQKIHSLRGQMQTSRQGSVSR